jgi:hypothetical protein
VHGHSRITSPELISGSRVLPPMEPVWWRLPLLSVGISGATRLILLLSGRDSSYVILDTASETEPHFSIFVPSTSENLDLYGYGNATSGNPITLWYTWNGTHQTWNFTRGASMICCSVYLR